MLSRRHLFSKLVLAAPCSFLSAAVVLHVLPVSRTHFFMKLVRAAPCKFLSVAREWQVSAMRGAGTKRQRQSERKYFRHFASSGGDLSERAENLCAVEAFGQSNLRTTCVGTHGFTPFTSRRDGRSGSTSPRAGPWHGFERREAYRVVTSGRLKFAHLLCDARRVAASLRRLSQFFEVNATALDSASG